jgi:hypothetical protein
MPQASSITARHLDTPIAHRAGSVSKDLVVAAETPVPLAGGEMSGFGFHGEPAIHHQATLIELHLGKSFAAHGLDRIPPQRHDTARHQRRCYPAPSREQLW